MSNVRRHQVLRLALIAILLTATSAAKAGGACDEAYSNVTATIQLQECRAAAERAEPEAEFGYGLVLWSGHDRAAQPIEAIEWLRRAGRHGHHLARVMLGRFLTDPEAPQTVRNLPEGYAWWLVAGEKDAAAKLRACEFFENRTRRLSRSEFDPSERVRIDLFDAAKG